jgi:hypothetical protein
MRIDKNEYGSLGRLACEGSNDEISERLCQYNSYERAEALALLMVCLSGLSPRRCAQIFLEWGNVCDAPWPYRAMIASVLRRSVAEVSLAELLEPAARVFYESFPRSNACFARL